MIHEILPVGMLQCNCSIFGDEQSREAIVIDPGDEIGRICEILERHGLKVKAIVVTHAHIDHVAGAAKLRRQTGAPVYMNQADQDLLAALDVQAKWLGMAAATERTEVDSAAADGTRLQLGSADSAADFHVMHTPGHTQGSLCILIPQEQKLIAGDTLFRGSVGRTNLPGGDSRQLLGSIKTKLLDLPDETIVVPGHGANTTIGAERESNPYLQGL